MNYILRIFYNNEITDIPLLDTKEYTVGSGTKDNFTIPNCGLNKSHIKIKNKNGKHIISCNGEVSLGSIQVKQKEVELNDTYVLNKTKKVAISIFEFTDYKTTVVDLSEVDEVVIGRDMTCDIVLHNKRVSNNHAKIYRIGGEFHISDIGSTNGTYINNKIIRDVKLDGGDTIIIGKYSMLFNEKKLTIYNIKNDVIVKVLKKTVRNPKESPFFKRSPRMQLDIPVGEIEIQAPPSIGSKPEIHWASVLIPSLGMVSVMILIIVFTGMNPMSLAFTLPMSIIGIVVSVVNYFGQKKKHTEQENLRMQKYTEHLDDIINEIEIKSEEQLTALTLTDPNTVECFRIVENIDDRLWERRPQDIDFMQVRLGSGSTRFSVQIRIPNNSLSLEEDNLKSRPLDIYKKYSHVDNAPITFSFLSEPICGIVGKRKDAIKLIKNMLVQISTHHAYSEVKIVSAFGDVETSGFEWVKNLPHSYDDEKHRCYMVNSKKDAMQLFGELEEIFKFREQELNDSGSYRNEQIMFPFYLFVISASEFIDQELITKYIYSNKIELGVGVVLLFDNKGSLPKECTTIIEVGDNKGHLYNKDNIANKTAFVFDSSTETDFTSFGDSIKLICSDEVNAKNSITNRVTLYELLEVTSADSIDLSKRWKESNITKSMAAPIGLKQKDEIVYLDLNEFAHGPHGLIAGTTGAGKSEVLQSYILSMATLFHPDEVGFVLIDFKGGGMANQFEKMPHLIGAITNIDGKEITRSLLSIKAEIVKRQKLFAEISVNHIDDYIKRYKNHEVNNAIPHLIIIVDEFAELKAEQPEFMNELISASRIGRSLGVHLILATQKPSGQVNEQIWSNSNFKICLRVASKEDSNDVIKSPLAASLNKKNPGRAYLKVGNDEIFDLFQSGYSGASTGAVGSSETQLNAIVAYIHDYSVKNNIAILPKICLPSLATTINYDEEFIVSNCKGSNIPIGVFDAPSIQLQGVAYINLAENTFILGASQTGKSNLLHCIVRTLGTIYSPQDVNIYIMDFASMTMKNFEKLNHVGGVVIAGEDEKLKNLFKLLITQIDLRKQKLMDIGVSSFSSYIEGAYRDIPRIIVIIDNYAVYKELYGDVYETEFLNICREGATYGISIILTNTQVSGYGYKYMSTFSGKISFTCNDTGEYSTLFDKCRIEPTNTTGRALYKVQNDLLEMQVYLAFKGEKEIERTTAMKSFIETTNAKYPDVYAKQIPCIPEELTREYIQTNYNISTKKFEYIIGLDYSTVDLITIDFNNVSEFCIVGKVSTDKKLAVDTLIREMKSDLIENPVNMYIVDSIGRSLKQYSDNGFIKKYTIDYSEIGNILEDISIEVEERYNVLLNESLEALDKYPLIAVVINNPDAVEYISSTNEILEIYKKIMKQCKGLKITLIFTDIDNCQISYNSLEILKRLKESKCALATDNLRDILFFDVPTNILRSSKELLYGDMNYFMNNDVSRIKLTKE